MKNLLKILNYFKKYKKLAFIGVSLIIIEIIVDLINPAIMASIINNGIGKNNMNYVIENIIILFLLTLISIIAAIFSTYYVSLSTENTINDIRKTLFKKVSELSFYSLDKIKVGHVVSILTNDLTLIGSVLILILRVFFRIPFILIGSIIMCMLISIKLSMLLIIIIPILSLVAYFFIKKAYPFFELTSESIDDVNGVVKEFVGGIRVVKSFSNEEIEKIRFDKVNQKLRKINLKAMKLIIFVMPVSMFVVNIAIVLVLWIGGKEVVNNNFEVGNIVAFIQYLNNILSALIMGSVIIMMTSKSEVSSKRINDFLSNEEDIKNTGDIKSKISGKIEFRNLNFEYESGTGENVLNDISFVINQGETIGIVGSTGSGKSTLVNLIPYFYEVEGILIDDIPIKEYNLEYLRNNIGICFQKIDLLKGTIRENLKINNSITDGDIINATKMSCAYEFIKEKGLDSLIEQGGKNLSGGEKQRLSIARTLLKEPKILILDDSLSAVDLRTDEKIRENLKNYYKEKTIIMVSSRIASIKDANRIIVLNDGNIVSIGTHNELLKNSIIYKEICDSQLNKDGE